MFRPILLVLCAALFARAHSDSYTHTCHIPTRAQSTFFFTTEDDCVHQRNALGAEVLPEISLSVKSVSEACFYKGETNTWAQRNTWAQYPRGLNLDNWQVDRRTSPVTLTFGRRNDPFVCVNGTECVEAETRCTTSGSAFCGGVVLAAWLSAAFFTFTRRNERRLA